MQNNVNQRLNLHNYVNRQFTDHVSHISTQMGSGRQHDLAAWSSSECPRLTSCRLLGRNGGVAPQCRISRPDRVALDEPQIVELRMVADFGARGTGGEIKMFPPPAHHGELEKWEDWSLQLKRYVGLLKPLAKRKMDDVEGSHRVTADDLSETFDMQQTGAQSNQLL